MPSKTLKVWMTPSSDCLTKELVFILDKTDYVDRVESALNDPNTFEKIENHQEQLIEPTIDAVKSWILKYTAVKDCPGMTHDFIDWILPNMNMNLE